MDNWTLKAEDFAGGKNLNMVVREKNIACIVERFVYDYYQEALGRDYPDKEKEFMTLWGAATLGGAEFNETETARRKLLEHYYSEEIKDMSNFLYNYLLKDMSKRYDRRTN